MNLVVVITITILLLMFAAFFIIMFLQYKNRRAVENKVYCTFIKPSKVRVEELLPVDGIKITRKEKGKNVPYYIRSDKTWNMLYPPNVPFFLKVTQVTVASAIFAEKNPEPVDPFSKEQFVTTELLANVQDEKFSELMLKTAERLRELDPTANATDPKFFWMAMGGLALLSGISIYLVFNLSSSIGDIKILVESMTNILQIPKAAP